MTIALVPDKFKGSLSSEEVAAAMEAGAKQVFPQADCISFFVSDGGDGFLHTINRYTEGLTTVQMPSTDAYGEVIESNYLWDAAALTAYIELAETVGLARLATSRRGLNQATTRGMGKQIAHALERGAQRVIMGLGGSATNDAGMGILAELGFVFLDERGVRIDPFPGNFRYISAIRRPADTYKGVDFVVVNDVTNPLLGPTGATYTYAGQKGAEATSLPQLESNLAHLLSLSGLQDADLVAEIPGSGAAGGTAFGLKAGLGAQFEPGAKFLLTLSGFSQLLQSAQVDLVLTGEGKMDGQTSHGKLIHGVVQMASVLQIPVMAVCGRVVDVDPRLVGLMDAAEIRDTTKPESYSFDHAGELVQRRTADLLHTHRDSFTRL